MTCLVYFQTLAPTHKIDNHLVALVICIPWFIFTEVSPGWKFILCFHLYIVSPNTFYTSIFVDLLLVSRFYRYIQKYVFVFRNGFFCRIRQGLEIGIVERIKLDLEWTIKP